MRTDSVNLSDLALNTAKQEIVALAGEKYHKRRQYQTKSKGAQEAHEAIRPTYLNVKEIQGTAQEKKLYELIWKRTLASQMADALIEKTTATISVSNSSEIFVATGEIIRFDGFLRVYVENTDNDNQEETTENILPKLTKNQILTREEITAQEKFSQHPPRYNEASLVRKLEELGIGRPSTYAPTISTIQNRGYVEKRDIPVLVPETCSLTLKKDVIKENIKAEKDGAEKNKLAPTDTGIVVNDFLIENFPEILNYNFTADVEQEFDDIAEGKIAWLENILSFYKKFHPEVTKASNSTGKKVGERALGIDKKSGKPVFVKIGRYGPVAQIGEAAQNEKPQFASLQAGQSIETITLEEALELFKLPMNIGKYENEDVIVAVGRFGPYLKFGSTNISIPKGENPLEITMERAIELIKMPKLPVNLGKYENEEIVVAAGRFGPYIKFGSVFVSVPKGENPLLITLERAVELIKAKDDAEKNKTIMTFDSDDIKVLNGRFGAYISHNSTNYKIPKDIDAQTLTLEKCKEIIASQPDAKTKKRFVKKK
jgi:DNA topoisomerase-1